MDEHAGGLESLLNHSIPDPPATPEEARERLAAAQARSQRGGERAGGDAADPWVYVPAHPVLEDGAELADYETRELPDGTRVLPAFTTVDGLIQQLGAAQPWLKARISAVIGLMGGDHVAIDPVIDPAAPRWDSAELERFTAAFAAERGGGTTGE